MRKYLSAILTFILFLSLDYSLSFGYENEIRSLSSAVYNGMDKVGSRKRVSIVDFTDQKGKATDLGKFLADELSSDLKNVAQGFEVLEREQFKSILAQSKLTISSPYEPNAVKKLGDAAKVGAIVTGSYTTFKDTVKVSINLVSTYMPKTVASASVDIPKKGKIRELLAAADAPSTGLNLTGAWRCDDGGQYYIRQLGNKIWWYGESSPNSPSWSNVAHGEISGNELKLRWADVPKGYLMNSGALTLEVISGGRMIARDKTGGFGGSEWVR